MQYYIDDVTDRVVGLTCVLNEKQAVKFFKSIETQENTFSIPLKGTEGQALVVLYQKNTLNAILANKPKGKELEEEEEYGCWDRENTTLWDNIQRLEEFFAKYHYVPSAKIYPKSAVSENVPAGFIRKEQVRYNDLKDLEYRGGRISPFIAECLRVAMNIWDFDKENAKKLPKDSTVQKAKSKSKKPRKPRLSKYDVAVKHRITEIVDEVNRGDRSAKFAENLSPKDIAEYLQDKEGFKKTKIENIEDRVGRCKEWKKRKETLQPIYGDMPLNPKDVFDTWTNPDTGHLDGLNNVENREMYEAVVEEYLQNLRNKMLLQKITYETYRTEVSELSPAVVAEWIKQTKPAFKNKDTESIKKEVKHSVAWINKMQTLDEDENVGIDMHEELTVGTDKK